MPSKYDKESLPVPKDAELDIKEVPKHKVAAHTSFGAASWLLQSYSNAGTLRCFQLHETLHVCTVGPQRSHIYIGH